ncbi:hypothetical protein BFS07_03655 [Clostridium perfringens]|uniref:plasmid mobilization protein n=1 Tax=Clostridium perfringens TaxID=1502 RepID=UPI00103FB919|nr:hypothetical protein [Clostridium perfringens]MCX0401984.1 hypothetical protein [Clostridium perfringens]TBX09818.1 hypothetical protein BFS07_03655 [Clostridium perfringens]
MQNVAIKFSRDDNKIKEIRFRVTPEEKIELEKKAKEMNLTLSNYMRYCIFIKEKAEDLKKYLNRTEDKFNLNVNFSK